MMNTEECSSDKDANNDLCARDYEITCETTTPIDLTEEELRML